MSLPFAQPDSGLMPLDELQELMPLPEVLGGTAFISTSGRVYRLFGSEEKAFSIPTLPEIPPILAAPKSTAFSLDEALQQIESFSSPATSRSVVEQPEPSQTVETVECTLPTAPSPTLQLFQALGSSAIPEQRTDTDIRIPLKLVKGESTEPITPLSVKDVIREVSQILPVVPPKFPPTPKEKRQQSLRVISNFIEEPFIVPFAKPESLPEEAETKNVELKIVTEFALPIRSSKVLKKIGQYRRKAKTLYRKQFSLPPVSVIQTDEEPPIISTPKPLDTSAFRWPEQLDSLKRTANNQIQMLTDHLIVQSNQGMKAICFKGVFSGDGCSTILLCAVRALMERNYRILLIDAHHRHVDLPKLLNLSGNLETGSEVITVNHRLGLWVWQESKTVEENTALLAEIVAAHRAKYDLILLDAGSVTESPLMEFVAFWNRAALNAVVLVPNTKRPSEMPVSHIAVRLRQHHIPLIGIAENYV